MKKAVIVPDSFKGTLSSQQVCDAIEKAVKNIFPQCITVKIPLSDGGEGFSRCIAEICGGRLVSCTACDPYGKEIQTEYAVINVNTAVIETAAASGLSLAGNSPDPEKTSTYGTGLMIKHALENGCTRILLGLGGSCTNDGGCGAAAALGTVFLDRNGSSFIPTGGTLKDIERIILPQYKPPVTAMCDVKNPLYGENGAAYVFAPQKGADAEAVKRLDEGLRHLSLKLTECTGTDLSQQEGAGAAGGLGAGVLAFFGGTLESGINAVLDCAGFEEIIKDADLIFTGEGKLDSQSCDGKVIDGVVSRAGGVPVIALAGGIEGSPRELYAKGLTAAFAINTLPLPLSESAPYSEENLIFTAENVLRTIDS